MTLRHLSTDAHITTITEATWSAKKIDFLEVVNHLI